MKPVVFLASLAILATSAPTVHHDQNDVTYVGLERNGIEVFLGIPYGQDTSGANRFKPPQPYIPEPGSVFKATKPGLPCPQQLGQWNPPLTLLNVTTVSENCLNLNIARPSLKNASVIPKDGFPVMLWIHGGSFWVGSNMEPTHMPDGLIRESVDNKNPVIHVAINYRLGLFGFAQSGTLKDQKSENAGLRDQRLAMEWVRDHIHYFGGNGNKITLFGQSSGGLAVGIHMLAYGGSKPLPYQQGICQSQALEPGIVHTIIGAPSVTQEAFRKVVVHTGCGSNNQTLDDMDKPEVIDCLRLKETQSLLDAAISTYSSDIAHNIGDIWLPSVDGDFLPDAPSKLLAQGRFGNATYMFGWAQDDVNFFTNTSIADEGDVTQFVRNYLPGLGTALVSLENGLISRYNAEEFSPRAGSNLTSSFYRTARIFRDILMVCEPLLMAEALNRNGNKVFLYNWNQTILDPILESVYNVSGMGVVHTSEFAYIYGNLSAYNVSGYPFNPTQQDYDLMHRASRTWSTFATKGFVGEKENGLAGWSHAFWGGDDFLTPPNPGYPYVYTIGGPMEGLFSIDGPESPGIVEKQKLVERCGFLNTPSIIRQIGF